jgi:hypothetical protein
MPSPPIRPHLLITAAVSLVVGASACSRTPSAGDAEYRYNLRGRYTSDMMVGQTSYSGSMDLATAPGGAISGTMTLTTPIPITAKLTGQLSGDSIAFGGPYRTPDCTGVLRGRGRIADGGRAAWGDVTIDDGCVGAMAGSFRLEK